MKNDSTSRLVSLDTSALDLVVGGTRAPDGQDGASSFGGIGGKGGHGGEVDAGGWDGCSDGAPDDDGAGWQALADHEIAGANASAGVDGQDGPDGASVGGGIGGKGGSAGLAF